MDGIVQYAFDSIDKLKELHIAWIYAGVLFFMAVESSFIPFPSEAVMPPAGYLIAQGHGEWVWVLFFGILGSLIGAWINYFLALKLGRPFCVKFGRYFFIKEDKIVKAEVYFQRHGEITMFVGRLIPVIRQLISLPAGIARMNLLRFSFYTGLGAGIWIVVLTVLGYIAGRHKELILEQFQKNLSMITIITLVAVGALVVGYILFQRARRRRASLIEAAKGVSGPVDVEVELLPDLPQENDR